jgi:xanthine dehydrogenase YagS FAD-binding subunit
MGNLQGTTVASARIVLGQVAPTPWVAAEAAKALAGKTVTAETAEEAAKAALAGATPLSHNAYKVQQARVAVKRVLLEAARGRA